jgi:hypothetical protein
MNLGDPERNSAPTGAAGGVGKSSVESVTLWVGPLWVQTLTRID